MTLTSNNRPRLQQQAKLNDLLLKFKPLFAPNELVPSELAFKTKLTAWSLTDPSMPDRYYSDTLAQELDALAGEQVKFRYRRIRVRDEKTRFVEHIYKLETTVDLYNPRVEIVFQIYSEKIDIMVGAGDGDVSEAIFFPDDLLFGQDGLAALFQSRPNYDPSVE
ncbi:hypothetical protein Q0M94_06320 [Deinococcus radiomollis]|uniref:hypothetical protein n=1 Tax=Deinococcus radiomollis TaxID=468916 RepID=UPI003892B832